MAEETKPGAAQNKLGELYVEFRSKGFNILSKGLGSLASGFGTTALAAKKATNEISKMSAKVGSNVIGLDKINAVTGMTVKQLQSLKAWATVNNIEFTDFIGQIQALQQNLLNIRMGKGNVKGLTLLGLDPRSMDYNKPLEALDMIRRRVQQVDEATGVMAMNELGLSQELLYAFKQNNEMIDKRLLLNNKEIEQARQQQSEWNKLKATWDAVQQKFIANQNWVNKTIEKTINLITEFVLSANKMSVLSDVFGQISDNLQISMYKALYNSARAFKDFFKNPVNFFDKISDFFTREDNYKRAFQRKYHITNRYLNPEQLEQYLNFRRNIIRNKQVKSGELTLSNSYSPQRHNQDVPVSQSAPSSKVAKLNTSIPSYIGSNIQLTPAQAKELSGASSYNLPPLPNIAQPGINNNQSKNVTININQNVTGGNSQETANNASEQIQKYFNSLQYSNLPGI